MKSKVIISAVFLILGIIFILVSLTGPCEADPFKVIGKMSGDKNLIKDLPNGSMEIQLPSTINRLLCIVTEPLSLIFFIIGFAFTSGGASGLVKNLTKDK